MNKVVTKNTVKRIRVRYYALFREARGLSEETFETDASTAREVYDALRKKYHFALPQEDVRVAVNDEFAGWDDPLKAGDELVFIPPVAGG